MKYVILSFALLGFTICTAQVNENKTEEKTTVKTTVKASTGEEEATKTVTKTAKQKIMLATEDAGETNQKVIKGAVKVNTETDYSFEDKPFRLRLDDTMPNKKAYIVIMERDGNMVDAGRLMPVMKKQNVYTLKLDDNKVIRGYFNAQGEFQILSMPSPDDLDGDGVKNKVKVKNKNSKSSEDSSGLIIKNNNSRSQLIFDEN